MQRIYVSRLVLVTPMGPNAMFSFVAPHPCYDGGPPDDLPELEVVIPTEAVWPGIELTVATLGLAQIIAIAGHRLGQIVRAASHRFLN